MESKDLPNEKDEEVPQLSRRLAFKDLTNTIDHFEDDNEFEFNLETDKKRISEQETMPSTLQKTDLASKKYSEDDKENRGSVSKISRKLNLGGKKPFKGKRLAAQVPSLNFKCAQPEDVMITDNGYLMSTERPLKK